MPAQKNSHSGSFWFLGKEFPALVARVSEIDSLLKIFRCITFLPDEFPSIQSCFKNLDSP